ncbi:ParM/StbA family protein [Niameybacter massiliensis]|uniref:ParM/StbA family protein n=1 Tax=Niameybacter massiliensis TaxID=1658108 RepID=UPI0006B3FC33|nr:ParM/StbA family protein [Niameybacter massiliensis]
MILALNAGFYNTKVRTCSTREIHQTRIQLNENGSRTLILGDCYYEIGAGSRDISDKQLSTCHNVCTNYNILKHATSNEVQLITALPMALYLNNQYRDKYRISMYGNHDGIVDGEYKKITVTDCTVFAEGAAAYLPHKAELKNEVVGLLDFGGNTINCMIYEYGNLLKDTISTLDLGMIKLERLIIDELNITKNWNVQDYEIRGIIKSGECKEIVDKCIQSHLKEIQQRLLEKKWNINKLHVFATGGGSNQLEQYLMNSFNRITISSNAIWDNVDGLYLVGREIYGKKTY